MQDLILALVQSHLVWEDKTANLDMFRQKLEDLDTKADVIVLPEMFTTGFSMEPQKLAEPTNGPALAWMREMASLKQAVITGSIMVEENGKYYNRLLWVRPDGSFSQYDKRHLFSMAGEHEVFSPGKELLLEEVNGWRICPVICYDLRFPVWLRNKDNYDLLIVVANWPERRIQHWRKLIQARAIENQSYVAGVNRYGMDGNNMHHNGSTMLADPMGEIETEIDGLESIAVAHLHYDEITRARRYMPFLKDMDGFEIQL